MRRRAGKEVVAIRDPLPLRRLGGRHQRRAQVGRADGQGAREDEGRGQLLRTRLRQSLDLEGVAEQGHLLAGLERRSDPGRP